MASKGLKKSTHTVFRTNSGTTKEAASIAASVTAGDSKKQQRYTYWPEWSDADINAEKWDAAHKGKEKEKGKSPVHVFEDPDGKVEMPPSVRVDDWKRPMEFITLKTPTIVDPDNMTKVDLLTPNEHAHESELLRWITAQISALWQICTVKAPPEGVDVGVPSDGENVFTWRPWEHIYAINKITGKTPNMPAYNPHGKYAVKLYWMGCWRKVIIDDTIPFDEEGHMLLPATRLDYELWPMLLSKALIKVASIEYNGGSTACEFGDFSVINCLTGWLPETIPLQFGHLHDIWKLLQDSLPEWKLPELNPETKEGEEEVKEVTTQEAGDDKTDKESMILKPDQKSKDGKDKTKDKDKGLDKKDKSKDKKEDKRDKSVVLDDMTCPDNPEIVIFAAYSGLPKYPMQASVLGEMADASERLRQAGLSHMYTHPVLLKQTRACPLHPPPPPEKVPAWKLIRPKKKKTILTDEPIKVVKEKPIQCVEITSPFINYRVNHVMIPTDIHRPVSSLERGGTRHHNVSVMAIEETDENTVDIESDLINIETPQIKRPSDDRDRGSPEKRSTRGLSSASSAKDRKKSNTSREDHTLNLLQSQVSVDVKRSFSGQATPSVFDHALGSPMDLALQIDEPGADGDGESSHIAKNVHIQNIWMDFEDFCKCFKTLYIFHKPQTYLCSTKYSDLKGQSDERTSHYLFVDNLKPTEIVVSFSAVCRWNEPPAQLAKEKEKDELKAVERRERDRASKIDGLTAESTSMLDGPNQNEPRCLEPVQPGLLVAELYSWKSLVIGQPILRLRTSATRATLLSLPAGRHLLRFHMQALLGYHVQFCSKVKFVFGDEDAVMTKLTEESCRFIDNATQMMVCLGKCFTNFQDAEAFRVAFEEFTDAHCPYRNDHSMSKTFHFDLFNDAFYLQLRKTLAEHQFLTQEMAFAFRTLFFDCTSKNILGLTNVSRPVTAGASDRGSAKGGKAATKRRDVEEKTKAPEAWTYREPTADEHCAVTKLQTQLRGFLVRKIQSGRKAGSEQNIKVQEQLLKAWGVIEPQMETFGLAVFRQIFKTNPELMPKYPFYEDEWNKVAFSDYQGTYPDQPANTWFIVFREVFHVVEEMLCVPKLICGPGPTCMLRVVNNDTGLEIPRVFQKVAPYVYTVNKRGYTFLAEARTLEHPLASGRWKMRLIGSLSPLPAPSRPEVNCSFQTRELRDYYVPNDKNIIFRYSVRVMEDHVTSLQMMTSKSDVYLKLSILDHEEVLISTVGKGHVVLPAFIFLKANTGDKRPSMNSALSIRSGKRVGSATKQHSVESMPAEEEKERPHKYIVQAMVLRDSWPISESAWHFVNGLKEIEKNELKVAFKETHPAETTVPLTTARAEKAISPSSTKGKEKEKEKPQKGKSSKEKAEPSRPPSPQFDNTKPNWTLRVVSDTAVAEDIEIRKDTERADEIRAMKKAWEEAQPGRAAKAHQSHLEYLKTHMVKPNVHELEDDEDETIEVTREVVVVEENHSPTLDGIGEEVLLLHPPPPPQPKEVLQEIDLTPYLRSSGQLPRLCDEVEIERQLEEKMKEIAEFRAYRSQVEAECEQDRINRNQLKVHQLELAEMMQACLDNARNSINKPREAFRQRFLEAEQRHLEQLAEAEAALRADQEKTTSPKGRKSSARKSAGKKSAGNKKGK